MIPNRPAAQLLLHRQPHLGQPVDVFLGLGGNVGNRLAFLRQGVQALLLHPEMRLQAVSRLYETEYVGPGRQRPFLNACVQVETQLPPAVLLSVLRSIECRCGRRDGVHMAPRTLDLDILFYGDRVCADRVLTVPHPRLRQRAFVLEPLAELAPDRKFPDSGETVAVACAKIRRKKGPWIRVCEDIELLPVGKTQDKQDKEDGRAAVAVHCR